MQTSAYGSVVAKRFRLASTPTMLTGLPESSPITFMRLRSDIRMFEPSAAVPAEEAYAVHVSVGGATLEKSFLREDGSTIGTGGSGSVFLFDLNKAPIAQFLDPIDNVRFFIPAASLREIAEQTGLSTMRGLKAATWGVRDPILCALAASILSLFDDAVDASTMFVDHVSLAFVAHLVAKHGDGSHDPARAAGGLAPWQMRRVRDYVDANLSRRISLADLADECRLSPGHFSRSFRVSSGRPPHKWLLERRLSLAKDLILASENLSLSSIAAAAGFADQSHLTRVFSRSAGIAPGAWKRENR